ncbi:MAG: TolC family protein [Candidatus Cloacimonetes bacterium]|nr:TolC family protein [Candidatus Cloacimonadota bacterium]
MIKKMLLTFIIMVLLPLSAVAEILTIEDAIEAGLKRSMTLEAELLQYRNQISSQRQNFYSWLPQANVSLSKNRAMGIWDDLQGSANLNWSISSNDPRYFEMRRQMIEMQNAALSLEDKKKNIAWQVLYRYIDVLQAQDLVNLQKDIKALEEKKYQAAIAEFKLGAATQQKVDEAELNMLGIEIRQNDLENTLQEKRRELFYYINLEDGKEELESLSVEPALTVQPYRANLQFQIAGAEQEVRGLNNRQAFLNLLPELSLSYNYSQSSTGDAFEFDEYEDSSQISLRLSYSLFDIFSNQENLKMTRRSWKFYNKTIEDIEKANRNELNNLNNSLLVQSRNYELYQRKSGLALRILEQAQMEYEQGELSTLDLNQYQNNYYSAREQEINGYYQVIRTSESINLHLSENILGKW